MEGGQKKKEMVSQGREQQQKKKRVKISVKERDKVRGKQWKKGGGTENRMRGSRCGEKRETGKR